MDMVSRDCGLLTLVRMCQLWSGLVWLCFSSFGCRLWRCRRCSECWWQWWWRWWCWCWYCCNRRTFFSLCYKHDHIKSLKMLRFTSTIINIYRRYFILHSWILYINDGIDEFAENVSLVVIKYTSHCWEGRPHNTHAHTSTNTSMKTK